MTLKIPHYLNVKYYTRAEAIKDLRVSIRDINYLLEGLRTPYFYSDTCYWFILRFNL